MAKYVSEIVNEIENTFLIQLLHISYLINEMYIHVAFKNKQKYNI